MLNSFLSVLLDRIYWLLQLVRLDMLSLDIRVLCTSPNITKLTFRFMNISGLAGLQCSYLIAFKQLVPEHTVTLFRSPLKIRVKIRNLFIILTNSISLGYIYS